MATSQDLALLKKVPLFAGLTARDLRWVRKNLRDEVFNAGSDIVREGDPSGRMFIITNGRVRVIVNGRTRRTEGPGAIIGELSVFDRGPRAATVRAEGLVDALSISSTGFLAMLADQPSMARAVMTTLARRLREADRQLTA